MKFFIIFSHFELILIRIQNILLISVDNLCFVFQIMLFNRALRFGKKKFKKKIRNLKTA